MPSYEFLCKACGPFDLLRSFSEASQPAVCPVCRSETRRIYTPPGLVRTFAPLTHARDRSHKSAFGPEVVTRRCSVEAARPAAASLQRDHGRPWQLSH
jgi:putative FmdB family regulatory protein